MSSTKRHLIRMSSYIEAEAKTEIFARLNIKFGPNSKDLVTEIDLADRTAEVEFDLAFADIQKNRMEKMWVDLIFEEPAMNRIVIRDLLFGRSPRAEL